MKILITEKIAPQGVDLLRQVGEVEIRLKPQPEELLASIRDAGVLLVRSQTQVTRAVIEAGPELKVIGRCGVGVDNIDLDAATKRGIIVVNSPWGNTIAAAELTIALLCAISRHLVPAALSLREGKWDRSRFMGLEITGKTLGLVGLGRVGSEVARRALGLGLRVIAYDVMVAPDRAAALGVEWVDLETLLQTADYVSLHVPLTGDTRHLIGREELARMKPTAYLINCARGGVVDETALLEALQNHQLAGAALDVWEQEPPGDNPLLKLDNVLPTPHLGASTWEAQENVAIDVARQVVEVLQGRPVAGAVNIPALTPEIFSYLQPFLTLAEKIGLLQAQLAEGRLERVELSYSGDLAEHDVSMLTRAFLRGLLGWQLGAQAINFVNALAVAEDFGVDVSERKRPTSRDYTSLIAAQVVTESARHSASGTVFGQHDLRIVELDGYHVHVAPEGLSIVFSNMDRPGVIGQVGTILGNAQINIAGMQVGRESVGGHAVTVLNVDNPVPPEVQEELRRAEGMLWVKLVDFGV